MYPQRKLKVGLRLICLILLLLSAAATLALNAMTPPPSTLCFLKALGLHSDRTLHGSVSYHASPTFALCFLLCLFSLSLEQLHLGAWFSFTGFCPQTSDFSSLNSLTIFLASSNSLNLTLILEVSDLRHHQAWVDPGEGSVACRTLRKYRHSLGMQRSQTL